MTQFENLSSIVSQIREKTDFVPEIAIVLGSGLGGISAEIDKICEIDTASLIGYPKSTVSGHAGKLIFGYLSGKRVVLQSGRVHFYEGYSIYDVVLPVRVMHLLGAKTLILTNATGGINWKFKAGDLMLIKGHISQFVPSPLVGANVDELGVRFPDMSEVYSCRLRKIAKESATRLKMKLKEGVYIQVSGPNYETPDEIRAFRKLGADAVGMSTAVEAMAAKHAGMEILGISLIANMGAGMFVGALSHEDVKNVANKSSIGFCSLIKDIVSRI